MRSAELINLLLDIAQADEVKRPRGRASSMRVVSRARSTSTTRSRAGSLVVHDIDEELAHEGEFQSESSTNSPTQHARAGPSTRRRVKETQSKLGVGRPVAIGGTGARAPSSSTSKPRSRRGRGTVTVQPSEVAIREEEEGT